MKAKMSSNMIIRHLLYILLASALTRIGGHSYQGSAKFTSEVNHSLTWMCAINEPTFTHRTWSFELTALRPASILYEQNSLGSVTRFSSARPDMSLNESDFTITIGRLQVRDNGVLLCTVYTDEGTNTTKITLVVYNKLVKVQYRAKVTLPCSLANQDFVSRQWDINKANYYTAFNQSHSQTVIGRDYRYILNPSTFELTVKQAIWIYAYICVVRTSQDTRAESFFLDTYDADNVVAEENTIIKLKCVSNILNDYSFYYRLWQRVNGDILYIQYKDTGVYNERRPVTRADISVDLVTFELTIGSVQLEDDSTFFCAQYVGARSPLPIIQREKLDVYINPTIMLTGLDVTLSVGSTVVVTCVIERAYPALEPDDFSMTVGSQIFPSIESKNNDKSYRYTVEYTLSVTEDVNGTMVYCNLNKSLKDSMVKTINVKERDSQDEILIPSVPVVGGVSLPVIGGAAAGGAVLLLLITIITACVCVRRKARVNAMTHASSKARRNVSHRDVSNRDSTYLPGADYHEYDEIPARGDTLHKADAITAGMRHLNHTGSYLHPPLQEEYIKVIEGPPTAPADDNKYEELRRHITPNTPIDQWFKDKKIPKANAKKLKRHGIITIQDVQNMSRADMVEAGLNVGDRNRIRLALKETGVSKF